jgi:hypothetical protein
MIGILVSALLGAHNPVISQDRDWLVTPVTRLSTATPSADGSEIVLSNGLISRTFRTRPNLGTVDYTNLITEVSILRGVKPEAVVGIDGKRYEIGGLTGQSDYAYLDKAWIKNLTSDPESFHYRGLRVGKPEARYPWKPSRHSQDLPWPPKGIAVAFEFEPPDSVRSRYSGLTVSVHYELYDGMPVLAKWVTVANNSGADVVVGEVEVELLAVTEDEKPRLHVESNYSFHGMNTTFWEPDPAYTSQTDYELQSPILMLSKYPRGLDVPVKRGETFESFRAIELLHDSDDRERRGLAIRRMYRTLAPQVTENPIYMHVASSDSELVRAAADQCAEVGFEMVILTFWSGFDIESEDPGYIARFKADVDYARGKGVELGGYTLMCASRDVGAAHNCISPGTGEPGSKFGQSACLASEWADGYFRRVSRFMDATGMTVIETDGPFHGDVCASTKHKHHAGLGDSQYRQWQACCDFYRECLTRGIYINTPDWYYLNGSNKSAMGYRETNFSLPRWRQILIARQNIFDGTYEKTPSMGWMFVPLVQYHGGGAEATLEPLSEHMREYEWHLAQNFGCGVQAAYRGSRLFDTDQTKAVVKKWVGFYKKHRPILDSDIIHVRRADGRGIDCMLHVNSQLKERGLAMVFNPTDTPIETEIKLPLYCTGLSEKALIREKEGKSTQYQLDRGYNVVLPVKVGAKGITWFVVERGNRE